MTISQIKKWLTENYLTIVAIGGAYSLYKIVTYFSGDDVGELGFTKEMKYPELMSVILKGESKGYNDHNYYKGGNLQGYVQGQYGNKYGALARNLSDYTLEEIMEFQKNSRSSGYGQLWAVGKYQMIPTTFAATRISAGLKLTDKFSPVNQDKMGMALLKNRPNTWKYITKQVSDSENTLNAAALDLAKEWSSIGVPYAMNGHWGSAVAKNESYYKPYDRASTKTEDIQNALKKSRKS